MTCTASCAGAGRRPPRRPSRAGAQVAALGTSPVPVDPRPVRTSRYERMAEDFGLTAHEQLTCGCHVHVEISSADEGVAVLDRAGPWLATLAGAERQLAVLAGTRQFVRELPLPGVGALAEFRADGAVRDRAGLPRDRAADGGDRHADRHGHGLLQRAAVRALPHHRDPDRRRVPARRRRRAHRRAGPRAGGNRGQGLRGRKGRPASRGPSCCGWRPGAPAGPAWTAPCSTR